MTSSTIRRTLTYVATHRRHLVVLLLTSLTYLVNRLDVYTLIATNISMANEMHYGQRRCKVNNNTAVEELLVQGNNSSINQTMPDFCVSNPSLCDSTNSDACRWYYTGLGWEYQLLAGPVYIILYSISAIPLGLLSEMSNVSRKLLLGACCLVWGLMTVFSGLCTRYWQLVLTRTLLGIASAGCVPFAASIISDYFTEKRGAALGVFNFGLYAGYSMTFLLIIAEKQLGWRAVYFIAGGPAVAIAVLIWVFVDEPPRHSKDASQEYPPTSKEPAVRSKLVLFRNTCRHFIDPSLLLLSLGAAMRNGAALVWAFNLVLFFKEFHPTTKIEQWMSWICLIFGSIGALGGGIISDHMSRGRGTSGRLIVLTVCNVLSAPCLIGTLYLPMPWAFVMQIPAFLIGEMWIGVTVAIVIDLVPAELTTSAVAINFFIIQLIGGNVNVLVTPLSDSLGYRTALLITQPVFYFISAALFLLTLIVYECLRRKRHKVQGGGGGGSSSSSASAAGVVEAIESVDREVKTTTTPSTCLDKNELTLSSDDKTEPDFRPNRLEPLGPDPDETANQDGLTSEF